MEQKEIFDRKKRLSMPTDTYDTRHVPQEYRNMPLKAKLPKDNHHWSKNEHHIYIVKFNILPILLTAEYLYSALFPLNKFGFLHSFSYINPRSAIVEFYFLIISYYITIQRLKTQFSA